MEVHCPGARRGSVARKAELLLNIDLDWEISNRNGVLLRSGSTRRDEHRRRHLRCFSHVGGEMKFAQTSLGRRLKYAQGDLAVCPAAIMAIAGIDLLLGNNFLRQFKQIKITYGDPGSLSHSELTFGELPVGVVLETPVQNDQRLICTERVKRREETPRRPWFEVDRTNSDSPA